MSGPSGVRAFQRLDSGQLLLICAAGLLAVAGVAHTAATGLVDPKIALGFGALIAAGELARLTMPGNREVAPIGAAAALGYTLLLDMGGVPAGHSALQVVAVLAVGMITGALPHLAVGRQPRLDAMARRLLTGGRCWRWPTGRWPDRCSPYREVLQGSIAVGTALLLSGTRAFAKPPEVLRQIGNRHRGGLSELAAAHELLSAGYQVTVLEARDRVSGRVVSFDSFVPGRWVEGGGELIGSNHPTWMAYAKKFGLDFNEIPKARTQCP